MKQKILVVEDNRGTLDLLVFYLRASGFQILTAENSADGIAKAETEQPELIITDLLLPDMTAVEATVRLKENPVTSGIPIIVLTGMLNTAWESKALNAGADEYLIKPVSLPALLNVIGELI